MKTVSQTVCYLSAVMLSGCSFFQGKKDPAPVERPDPAAVIEDVASDLGYQVTGARYVRYDIDPDPEIAAACTASGQVYVCIFDTEKTPKLIKRSEALRGEEVRSVDALDFSGVDDNPTDGFLMEVVSNTPDGVAHELVAYRLDDLERRILSETVFKDGSVDVVTDDKMILGDGDYIWKVGDNGSDIWVRVGEQSIEVETDSSSFLVVPGIYHKVLEFDGETYQTETERTFHPFLSRIDVSSVKATSALNTVSEEPVVLDGASDMVPTGEMIFNDYAEARAVADGDQSTGWLEGQPGLGSGQGVEILLGEVRQITMLRVVPGCVETEMIYERYARPKDLQIDFGNGMAFINLSRYKEVGGEIKGIKKLPLDGRDYGAQYLIFLKSPVSTDTVKVSIGDAIRGESDHTCISEVAFY